jgi:hypothetical protein
VREEERRNPSYIQRWSVIKIFAEDVSDERAIDAFLAGLRHLNLVEEVGRTRPRAVSDLMEVANKFADGEDTYNNKRGYSPEVDRASRQRRRYRNGESHPRRNQITAGYKRRDEEGYENREFQARGNHGVEEPKYSGPSAEDMLYGPCHIHYAYLDGKKVSNHQMKDCRTFLRLQSAMDSNQGTRQEGKSTSQGYQVQRLAKHLESKVYIFAMIQLVPKTKKERKSISKQVNLAISSPPETADLHGGQPGPWPPQQNCKLPSTTS